MSKINGHSISGRDENIGIRIENSLEFEADGNGGWRFCIPTLVYTMPQKLKEGKLTTFMEDRLSANMVIAYDETKRVVCLLSKRTVREMWKDQ